MRFNNQVMVKKPVVLPQSLKQQYVKSALTAPVTAVQMKRVVMRVVGSNDSDVGNDDGDVTPLCTNTPSPAETTMTGEEKSNIHIQLRFPHITALVDNQCT